MEQYKELLEKIYYNPLSPGSFGGATRLHREAIKINRDIKIEDVKNWLRKQHAYNLFKPRKLKFRRLPIIVDHLDEQWQADLLDMSWFKETNDGVRFLLTVTDVLSRYAWVVPLTDKSGQVVKKAMKSIFKSGRVPVKLQTDQGKEFLNSKFNSIMEKFNVHHFTTKDDQVKCAIVERFNRTLRERIYRYMYWKQSDRYLDALPDIVNSYNNSFHRSIKMSPAEVTTDNEPTVLKNLQQQQHQSAFVKDKLKGEEYVRIARKKGTFEKGATRNFSEEIFKIERRKKTPQKFIYHLVDLADEPITGLFYPEELVAVDEPSPYKARVLTSRTRNGRKQHYISFLGYPESFNRWIG